MRGWDRGLGRPGNHVRAERGSAQALPHPLRRGRGRRLIPYVRSCLAAGNETMGPESQMEANTVHGMGSYSRKLSLEGPETRGAPLPDKELTEQAEQVFCPW